MNYEVELGLTVFFPNLERVLIFKKIIKLNYIPFIGLSFSLPFNPSVNKVYYNGLNNFKCILEYPFGGEKIDKIWNTIEKINDTSKIYKDDSWLVINKSYKEMGL